MSWFKKKRQIQDSGGTGSTKLRKISPGRSSVPSISLFGRMFHAGSSGIVPRRNVIFDIDIERLKNYPTEVLLRNLHAISPETSMALWNYLRLCSSPFKCRVIDPKGNESLRGKAYIDEVVALINPGGGGVRNLQNQLHKTIYVQGAASGEVVLAENLRDTLDIVAVDPSSITFFQENYENGQIKYIPKQLGTVGGWISLDKEGFYYVPLDPDVGDPYGSSPLLTMIQVVFFDLQVMFDVQKVTHNSGYPRIHLKLVEEILRKNAPAAYQNNDKKMQGFIDQQLDAIEARCKAMEPDDSYITTDAVEIKEVQGTGRAAVTAKVLTDVLKSKLANSLKQLSIFLNLHQGKTETYGTVEWRIQVDAIESVRAIAKSVLDSALTFALRMKGIQGKVEVEYEPIPIESLITLETAEWMRTKRLVYARDAGLIDHDEVASELFNLEVAAGEAVPMNAAKDTPASDNLEAIPGENVENRGINTDRHKGSWFTVKAAKIADLETSYLRKLRRVYGKMRRSVVSEVISDMEFED